jgi:hypothetical protein
MMGADNNRPCGLSASTMNTQRQVPVGMLLVGLPLLACATGLILLHRSFSNRVWPTISNKATVSSALVLPGPQRVVSDARRLASQSNGSQMNVLELPKASLDFVGEWGGYTHSVIHSVVPGHLSGKNPDRVSIIFGRSADTVFITSELYSSPNQRLLGEPVARVANPGEALIEYESEDAELHYGYTHSFGLLASGRIAYRERVFVYERRTNHLVGFVEQRATLKRLLTADEQILFARPSLDQVPWREVSSSRDFSDQNSKRHVRTH